MFICPIALGESGKLLGDHNSTNTQYLELFLGAKNINHEFSFFLYFIVNSCLNEAKYHLVGGAGGALLHFYILTYLLETSIHETSHTVRKKDFFVCA